jgi:cob(I)alamin adenosyltransferase
MLWFSSETPQYLAATYRLETLKADILKTNLDLDRTIERKARAENNLELLDVTLAYLRKAASVVSMSEYQKIVFQRASELGTIITDSKTIPLTQSNIKIMQAEVDRITGDLPSMKAKILEFKRRD